MMAENQRTFFQWLAWLFRPEDSIGGISEKHFWFEREKNRCLHESEKHLGWVKAIFWIMAAHAFAFLISRL